MGGLWCSILAMNVPDLVLFSTFRHANMIKHGRPKHHYNTDTFLTHTTFSKPTYVLPPKKNRQTCHVPTCWISNSHRELVTLKVLQLARPWQWVPASDPRCMFCNDGWPHKWHGHYLNRPVNVSFKGHWILNFFLFKGRTPITKILQVFSCPKDPQTNGAHPTPRFCMDDWNKLGLSSSSGYDLALDVWTIRPNFKHLKHKIRTDQTFTSTIVQVSTISLKFKSGSSVITDVPWGQQNQKRVGCRWWEHLQVVVGGIQS